MKIMLILWLILVKATKQQCAAGCLKCNSSNQCIFCDTSNSYVISGNSCVLATDQSCLFFNQNGSCIQCKANYYIDQTTLKCVAVSTINAIKNCAIFSSTQSCVMCLSQFYLSSGACTAVINLVTNCKNYLGDAVCAGCNSGFILSLDGTKCVATPNPTTCQLYTYATCGQCAANYFMNSNAYFANYSNFNYVNNLLNNLKTTFVSNVNAVKLQVCQPVMVANCETYTSPNTCTTCISGYYLANSICVPNPITAIANCLNYSGLTTCINCKIGYYLSQNKCNLNTVIAGCTLYSQKDSTTTCLACDQQSYLSSNTCVLRTKTAITNCQTLSVNSNTCSVCSADYVLTTDKLACLPATPGCQIYVSGTTESSTSVTCQTCSPLFYLTTAAGVTSCTAGSITNCAVYSNSQTNVCTTCSNGFYLSSNACIVHKSIANCMTYSQTTANTCSVCNHGFYNFIYSQVCSAVTLINGCQIYAANGLTCTTCQTGYYQSNPTICSLIPTATFPNCISFLGTACLNCAAGFMLNSLVTPATCIAPFDYLTKNCIMSVPTNVAQWLGASHNPINCVTCGPNMYGYTPVKSEAICVLATQLVLYSPFSAISNCLRYGISYANTPALVCMQCVTGSFLSSYSFTVSTITTTSCVGSCNTSTGANALIMDDLLGFVNICMSINSGNGAGSEGLCQKYVRTTTVNMAISDFACISASNGNVLRYTFSSTGIAFEGNVISSTTFNRATQDYLFGFDLADGVTTTLIPTIFNYRGINLTPIPTPTLLTGVSLLNCDIIWTIGGTTAGSAFRPTGGSGGAYTALIGSYSSCLRCSFGFRLQFTTIGATNNFPIPNCVTLGITCQNSSIRLGGLPTYLNALFSCHYCAPINGQATFPTIFVEIDAISITASANIIQFSLPAITGASSSPAQGFMCSLPPTVVTYESGIPTTVTITNCAAYGVLSPITAYKSDPLASNTRNFCLACATGFYPIHYYIATSNSQPLIHEAPSYAPPYAVSSCVQSYKCDTTSPNIPFNSCGKCTRAEESQLIPKYYAYSDWRLINCLPTNSQNCFILFSGQSTILSSTVTNPCGVCASGYFLNSNKICDMLGVPNQASGSSFVNSYFTTFFINTPVASRVGTYDLNQVRVHYQLSFTRLQYGVTSCAPQYVLATPFTSAASICTSSTYLLTGTLPGDTFYIQNCLQYDQALNINKIVCFKCVTGLIPTEGGGGCVAIIPGCTYARIPPNTANCATCVAGFLNVAGTCSSSIIGNCQTYLNTAFSYELLALNCKTCNDGFYLSSDSLSCISGAVQNCKTYANGLATSCTACKNGYTLMTLASSTIYCYPIPSSLNCETLQDQSSATANNARIFCTTCMVTPSQVYGVVTWVPADTATLQQTLCMPFNPVTNCISYDQANAVIAQNTFKCTACSNVYYLSSISNSCVLRTVLPLNCTTFSPTSDICTACNSFSFLSSDSRSCIANPIGIFGCLVYKTNTTCFQCSLGLYMSNNQCLSPTPISNCLTYTGNNICSTCQSGYYLQNPTTCVQATATGCLTYTSASVCATCPVGSIKSTASGVTNCIAVTVANCARTTTTTPYTCLVCNDGYYADLNGVCQQVTNPIFNCLSYLNNTACSLCNPGFVLNPLGSLCQSNVYTNLIDSNCVRTAISNAPLCAVCAFGYYFVDGICKACSGANMTAGCLTCNPNNATSCLICAPGWFQTASGTCSQGNQPIQNSTLTTLKNVIDLQTGLYWLIGFWLAF